MLVWIRRYEEDEWVPSSELITTMYAFVRSVTSIYGDGARFVRRLEIYSNKRWTKKTTYESAYVLQHVEV